VLTGESLAHGSGEWLTSVAVLRSQPIGPVTCLAPVAR
jgi:hypothetical protein